MILKIWGQRQDFSIGILFSVIVVYIFNLQLSLRYKYSELMTLLNVLFFLGFVFKPYNHLLWGYEFIEPAGKNPTLFVQPGTQLSLWIGLMLSVFNCGLYLLLQKTQVLNYKYTEPLKNKNNQYFYIVCIFSIALYGLNAQLGFLRVGIASEAHVLFPFSFFYSWFLGLGSAFLVFLFLNQLNFLSVLALFALTICASVSVMSRNLILLYLYPVLVYVLRNTNFKLSIKNICICFLASIILFFSIFSVTLFRKALYANKNINISTALNQLEVNFKTGGDYSKESKPQEITFQDYKNIIFDQQVIDQIKHLFLDRWIGFEGLLVALQNQSDENFVTLLNENQKNSVTTLYSTLSKNDWQLDSRHLFYTFPGPFGFIFISRSFYMQISALFAYFLALFIFVYISEVFFTSMSKSVMVWWVASVFSQMSLFVKFNSLIHTLYFVLPLIIVLIFNRQKKRFNFI
jgi:hypothetical protein